MIDLRPDHLNAIKEILKKHTPDAEVWAFGSRVKWTAKDYSDLDLVVIEKQKLPQKRYFQLQDAFKESELPIRVDVLDWHRITPEFRVNIEKKYEVIRSPGFVDEMSGWPIVTIDSIKADSKGSIAIGPFGSRMKSNCYVNDGIPVIRGTNITGGPTFEGDLVYITEDKADTLGSSNVYQYDLVFPHRGSIGEVGIILDDERYVLSSSLMKLTCDRKRVNPKFLYYFFKSRLGRHELLKNASQVGTPGIGQPLTSLKSIELRLPPLSIQDQIEIMLTLLDEKIQLNRQTNQTLEQIAQAIFKSWFVDFEPVKAKIAAKQEWAAKSKTAKDDVQETQASRKPGTATETGENAQAIFVERAAMCAISGKTLDQLDQLSPETQQQLKTTAALFPEALVDSELGEIPEGWVVKCIGELGKVITGKTPPKKVGNAYSESGVPFITLTDIDVSMFVTSKNRYLSNEGQATVRKTEIESGSICVTCIGSQMGEAIIAPKGAFTNQKINSVVVNENHFRNYILLNLRNRREEIFLIGSSGSTMPIINKSTFEKLSVLLPSEDLLSRFDSIVGSSINKILENKIESLRLSELRDTLLPKLLSGEIDLNDTQPNTESAA